MSSATKALASHIQDEQEELTARSSTQTAQELLAREEAEFTRDKGSAKDFRYLFPSFREYGKYAAMTSILIVIEAIFELMIPTYMARLIDYGITPRNMAEVWHWGLILILLAILSIGAGVGAAFTAARSGAGFAKNLRRDLFEKVQAFSFANIEHFSTGSIITRLTTDVTNVQNSLQMIFIIAFRAPVMMIVSIILCFRLNAKLSLIYIAVMIVLGVVLLSLAGSVHPIFVRVFHTYDVLNSSVEEDINGIRVVKGFNREAHQSTIFRHISQRIYELFCKAEFRMSWIDPAANISIAFIIMMTSWVAAHEIVASGNNEALGMTTGDLTSLFSYAIAILMSMMMLMGVFVMIIISRASASRMAAILLEKSDMQNPEHPLMDVPDGSVDFDDVVFRYDAKGTGTPVVDHVSMHIPSGSTIGIIGETGSAKSSLVQLIPRLYDVQEGSVKVGGHDVREYDMDVLRHAVSMVLQKNTLFTGTIAENLRWGNPDATDEQLRHAAQLAHADDFVQEMPKKYDTMIEEGGTNVSGGQKQRLTIARAILRQPKVLILDDSTSAVDTKTDADIRRAFATELPNTTKIIIAQRLSSVESADQIFYLKNGMIAAQGTHEELMESSQDYRSTWLSQNEAKQAGIEEGIIDENGNEIAAKEGEND